MNNKYVVYELICPIESIVKYVGMSRNVHGRYKGHRKGDEKSTKEFSKSLREKGLKPILKVAFWELTKREAIDTERELIKFYMDSGMNLLNTYIGTTPNTKKERKTLSSHLQKMAITRKLQCQDGKERDRLIGYNESRKCSIIDQDGTVYESMRDAERKTGCYRASIKKVMNGEWSQTNGYIFKRAA